MIEDKILQLQREREKSPATFEVISAINREHKLTRSYVIENGLKLDRLDSRMDNFESRMGSLENRVENLERDVGEIKADVSILKNDVSILKTDVSTLKDNVSEILKILKKEG
jgi:chromosome segregation ATPase